MNEEPTEHNFDVRPGTSNSQFLTTQWSLVVAAANDGQPGDAKGTGDSLAVLCKNYWQPLYRFARRFGYQQADSQDLVQAFFERLIEKRFIDAADPNRGRFRTFLLAAFKNFARNEWVKQNRQKRGGNIEFLDFAKVDQAFIPSDELDGNIDAQFDKDWATDVRYRSRKTLR